MSTYHFISGLPRSGSTLLSALLKQNPAFSAGISSPVYSMAMGLMGSWTSGKEISPLVSKEQKRALIKGLFEGYHNFEHQTDVVFDTNRGWTEKLTLLDDLFPESRVICCVRDIAWILDSFEKLFQQDPYENTRLYSDDARSTVFDRTYHLASNHQVVGYAARALRQAFHSKLSSKLILVKYEDLVSEPKAVLNALYTILGESKFDHDFENVQFDAKEFDANLGVPGLHKVKPKVQHYKRQAILPPSLFEEFSGREFWLDKTQTNATILELPQVK